jgi:SAM-dependent methyltransferase
MPDPIFSSPQLVTLYDMLEGERCDLEFYIQLVDKLAARRVVDIGCGTGAFAGLLASRGVEVIGLDPADASLTIARQRQEVKSAQWILGDTTCLPPLDADMATMTGNVAQVFLTDDDWLDALGAIGRALRPKGYLAFETRTPAREAWRNWNRGQTDRRIEVAGMGLVRTWCAVTKVDGPLVSFRWTYEFEANGAVMVSDSTLRFRDQAEIVRSLDQAGYVVDEVLDAPDRSGSELTFVAHRTE